MANRLTQNALTLLLSNAGSALLSFVLSILIGRVLGQDGLGVYGVVLAWVFPLRLAAEFGLGTLITRDVAQDPAAGPDYLRATMPLRLGLGVGWTALLWLAAPLISADPLVVQGLRLSAPMLLVEPFFAAFTALFRANKVMWPIAWLNIGMLAAQVGLTAFVFARGDGVLAALAVNTFTSAGQLLAAWLVYRWRFWRPPGGRHFAVGELLRRAWPFALAAFLAALQTRLGTILLERLTDAGQAGYYTAAGRFIEAARMVPNALFGALLPALAGLAAHPASLNRVFGRVTLALAAFGGLAGVGAMILAAPLLDLTYGPAFAPAEPALQLLAWALLPALLRSGRILYWYARGREAFVNWVTGGQVLIQVALGLWLIPAGGAVGAALALLLSEVAALVLIWRGVPALLPGRVRREAEPR